MVGGGGGTSQRHSLSYSHTYVMGQGGEMMNSVWGMLSVHCLLASLVEMAQCAVGFTVRCKGTSYEHIGWI